MEVYLIRHTTLAVEKGIIYGHLDIDVADTFLIEAENIRTNLHVDIEVVFSSPSLRCVKLAKYLFSEFQIDNRLLEINFGEWEGKKWDEIPLEELDPWMADYEHVAPPNGENLAQLRSRVQDFLCSIDRQSDYKVAIITHAGVIRVLKSLVEGKSINDMFNEKVPYGSISKINL